MMSLTRLCRVEDIPKDGMQRFETESGDKVLVLNSGDEYYAYQAICPHQEVELCEGFYDGSVLTCHQHLWQWDVKTGAPMGLAETGLEFFELQVKDGEIYIGSSSALDVAPLFEGLSSETRAALSKLAREEQFEEGSTIYDVGDSVQDLYILDTGRIEFLLGRDDRVSPAGFILRKGEVFGWAALLQDQPRRIAKASCIETSSVLALNGQAVLEVLGNDPAAGYQVMTKLVHLVTRYLASSGAK
ncbi:MAG: Rieske 2Fe-2S domain-containing protein [Gammaproteobacteria bacterium]